MLAVEAQSLSLVGYPVSGAEDEASALLNSSRESIERRPSSLLNTRSFLLWRTRIRRG